MVGSVNQRMFLFQRNILKSLRRGSFLTHIEATKPLYITPSPISLSSPAVRYFSKLLLGLGLLIQNRIACTETTSLWPSTCTYTTLLRLLIIHLCLRVTLTLPYHPLLHLYTLLPRGSCPTRPKFDIYHPRSSLRQSYCKHIATSIYKVNERDSWRELVVIDFWVMYETSALRMM